ncbi:YozE family protein [Paenisporosarcina cavernae]|uniref:YozE family protein n=1 Tax=Paenisporosarcina cavernae TaxID=2320858 RepID=A0A385YT10_9BACL|nr:YozE family protein [Paenisporosarcina cavernae]AYC29450.1 YozE family protein [Paenisporosarcina cavernae]
MNKSFYQFVLTFRGAKTSEGVFAEAMFEDLSFPKQSRSFSEVSRYIEELADERLSASQFDALWSKYQERI